MLVCMLIPLKTVRLLPASPEIRIITLISSISEVKFSPPINNVPKTHLALFSCLSMVLLASANIFDNFLPSSTVSKSCDLLRQIHNKYGSSLSNEDKEHNYQNDWVDTECAAKNDVEVFCCIDRINALPTLVSIITIFTDAHLSRILSLDWCGNNSKDNLITPQLLTLFNQMDIFCRMEIELPPGADFGVEASGENNQQKVSRYKTFNHYFYYLIDNYNFNRRQAIIQVKERGWVRFWENKKIEQRSSQTRCGDVFSIILDSYSFISFRGRG